MTGADNHAGAMRDCRRKNWFHTALATTAVLLWVGCGAGEEAALSADTAEESADDLITYFAGASDDLKKTAKAASDALKNNNYSEAFKNLNQLKASQKLTTDQFMVVSESVVNLQTALIDAADSGDREAQRMLNIFLNIKRD